MMNKTKELVQYEEVQARNPTTGEISTVKIEKPKATTPEQRAEEIGKELKEMGLEISYSFEVTDPLSGKKQIVTLDRAGHTNEGKLAMTLADPNLSRDRKDFAVSMYLYERGSHNTSMLLDLMRYKGTHTKETRVFKSQIRYDFEAFVGTFTTYLKDQQRLVGACLGIDIWEEKQNFMEFCKEAEARARKKALEEKKDFERESYTYYDFMVYEGGVKDEKSARQHAALVSLAMHAADEAETLSLQVKRMAEARERDKGKGIYMDSSGRPYTQDDPDLQKAIDKDREITAEAKKDE